MCFQNAAVWFVVSPCHAYCLSIIALFSSVAVYGPPDPSPHPPHPLPYSPLTPPPSARSIPSPPPHSFKPTPSAPLPFQWTPTFKPYLLSLVFSSYQLQLAVSERPFRHTSFSHCQTVSVSKQWQPCFRSFAVEAHADANKTADCM